jgi:hypothetical protein
VDHAGRPGLGRPAPTPTRTLLPNRGLLPCGSNQFGAATLRPVDFTDRGRRRARFFLHITFGTPYPFEKADAARRVKSLHGCTLADRNRRRPMITTVAFRPFSATQPSRSEPLFLPLLGHSSKPSGLDYEDREQTSGCLRLMTLCRQWLACRLEREARDDQGAQFRVELLTEARSLHRSRRET